MARLVKTPAGTWKVRHYDGTLTAKGRPREVASQTFARKVDAAEELRRVELEVRTRKEVSRARPGRVLTMAAVLKLWGGHVTASGAARKEHVAEVQRVLGAICKAREWAQVATVSADRVSAWRSERGGKGTDKPLSMLKSVLRYARDYLRQRVDPLVVDMPGRRGVARRESPPLLTAAQVSALVVRARERGGVDCGAIIAHLATYGCRPVDACRLRVRDFNAVAGTLTLGAGADRRLKNKGKATHPLLPVHVELYRTLIGDREPDAPLFLNASGEGWAVGKSAGQLLDWYTANVSEHLLPRAQWGLYCLKDYAISTMDRDGIDDRTKALFTGHRSLAVFERYKTTNQERAASALDRMRPAGERATDPTAPALRPDGRTSE